MEIKFKIETLGYIIAEFMLRNKVLKFRHSSSYGDKFQELLNNFFFIYDIAKNKNTSYFPFSCETSWEDDFINYLWIISINSPASSIEIKVYELSPSNLNHKVECVNEKIEIENLFHYIYISLEEIFVDFGFIGYKKNWEVGNFPIYEYIMLKSERNRIELTNVNEVQEEKWKQKINVYDELKVLISNLEHPSDRRIL